jgi:DNA polymerase-3 subunit beta
MKLKINKDVLLENLNNVGRALSNRNIIPVINGILFELTSDGLYLTATDNEITIKTFIDKSEIKEIKEEGKIVIYGRFILDIIRKLQTDDIDIEEIDGGKAIISTPTSKYNLNCFEVNDFPNVKMEYVNNPIKLTAGNFKEIVNQTVFATSQQESKPLLTGINLKILANSLECVATDSYRLAKKNVKFPSMVEDNINLVIPAKNINEFVKLIEEDNDEIEMHAFNNKVLFKYRGILFQSSLLNGSYPNTDSLVPSDFDIIYKINLNEFYNVMDRASILAQAKDKNIVSLESIGNKVVITSSSPEIGKIEEVMNIDVIKGGDIKISFSAKYMMEALRSFNSEDVTVYFNGEIKPIIIREDDNGDLLQLILPIKTY